MTLSEDLNALLTGLLQEHPDGIFTVDDDLEDQIEAWITELIDFPAFSGSNWINEQVEWLEASLESVASTVAVTLLRVLSRVLSSLIRSIVEVGIGGLRMTLAMPLNEIGKAYLHSFLTLLDENDYHRAAPEGSKRSWPTYTTYPEEAQADPNLQKVLTDLLSNPAVEGLVRGVIGSMTTEGKTLSDLFELQGESDGSDS
jgi:hypothetical protein